MTDLNDSKELTFNINSDGSVESGLDIIGNNQQQLVTSSIGDNLAATVEEADKNLALIRRIKVLSLKSTNAKDWTNQNGKPYLMVSGAEKVARLFGICWTIEEPRQEVEEDGSYYYTCKGIFTMKNQSIEAIGCRSGKDPFFSRQKNPDKTDVKKAAYTNCIGNGVNRILGIRNLDWDDLAEAGLDINKITSVDYKKAKPVVSNNYYNNSVGETARTTASQPMPLLVDDVPEIQETTYHENDTERPVWATDKQLKAIWAIFNTKHIINKEERLGYINNVINREIESSNQLTLKEASMVIEALKK